MKTFLLFLIAASIIALQASNTVASRAVKTRLNIVYTNDVMGEVEPCG